MILLKTTNNIEARSETWGEKGRKNDCQAASSWTRLKHSQLKLNIY